MIEYCDKCEHEIGEHTSEDPLGCTRHVFHPHDGEWWCECEDIGSPALWLARLGGDGRGTGEYREVVTLVPI